MNYIEWIFEKLTEEDRKKLLEMVNHKSEKGKLPKCEDGEIFKIADMEFIKFPDEDGSFAAVHTADVASNAEKLEPLILAMNEKNDRLPIMLAKAKTETARSIFKDLREMVIPEKCTNGCDFYIDMAELTALEEEYCGKDTNDGRKKTNFDRIKEMSVEEFSEFLCKLYFGEDCPPEYAKDLAEFFESEVNENG